MDPRKNNFDFLRIVFATFVIITHSYPLTGMAECDWLCQLTNDQLSFSYVGVKGFFIISGYLIFQSMERSRGIVDYYWKRLLRLFPALFVVLLLTVLLAPFVYESSLPYLKNISVWTYLPNNLTLFKIQYNIQGVFEHNPFKGAVNGSLWTIPYEFTMYVFLSLFIFLRKNKTLTRVFLAMCFTGWVIAHVFFLEAAARYTFFINGKFLVDLGVFFMAGALLSALRIEKLKYQNLLFLISLALLILSLACNVFTYAKFITLPLAVILFGLQSTPVLRELGSKVGDLSYGVYIYAFPVQQTLVYYFAPNYWQLMLISIPITYILAYVSWHCIEKQALTLKNIHPATRKIKG